MDKLKGAFEKGFKKEAQGQFEPIERFVRGVGKRVGQTFEPKNPSVHDDLYSASKLEQAVKNMAESDRMTKQKLNHSMPLADPSEIMSRYSGHVRKNQRRLGYQTLGTTAGLGLFGTGYALNNLGDNDE